MTDEEIIQEILRGAEIPLTGAVIANQDRPRHYFVYVEITRSKDNLQIPSNRSLNNARQLISANEIAVEFLLTDAQFQNIEAGLRATLLHAFGEDIRNVFLSLKNSTAHIWYESKREFTDEASIAIRNKIEIYLNNFDLALGSLSLTTDENLPGKLAVLNTLRHIAPASLGPLKEKLETRRFVVPSDDWLRRRLDVLRKGGMIIRLANDTYVLSSISLQNLGTLRSKKSPDVSRLLALAKKDA